MTRDELVYRMALAKYGSESAIPDLLECKSETERMLQVILDHKDEVFYVDNFSTVERTINPVVGVKLEFRTEPCEKEDA